MRFFALLAVLSVALFSGCPTAGQCSPATCATGCCDASGTCQGGTAASACGIAGNTCSACQFTQQCIQGSCFASAGGTGGSGGGGGGGGGGGTGGGTGGGLTGGGGGGGLGGGMGGGTTGGGGGLLVFPMSATVPERGDLVLSAKLFGNPSDTSVNFEIESGNGTLIPYGPSSAYFYAASAPATVRIRASANFMSSVAQQIELTIDSSARRFDVAPQGFSQLPYTMTPNMPQTFSAVRPVSSNVVAGIRDAQFILFPSLDSSMDGTLTVAADQTRLYAQELSTNVFASTDIAVMTTNEASIAITPSLTTTSPNGVVQFTAMVSTGAPVQWDVVSGFGTGTISSSGTYTAPSSAGVYVVRATVNPSGLRYALATIIVQ